MTENNAKRAKVRLGQNFLEDKEILAKIVKSANLTGSEVVIEIGPGKGVLTRELCEKARLVVVIELDKELIETLLPSVGPVDNLRVIPGDAVKLLAKTVYALSLEEEYKRSLLVMVSNLPYEITTPILYELIDIKPQFARIILLIQDEVARKMIAGVGNKARTVLTVLAEIWADIEYKFKVPKEAFMPMPKVDGAVIEIMPKAKRPAHLDDKKFRQLLKIGFSQKRKKILNVLAGGFRLSKEETEDWLSRAGVNSSMRAEDLNQFDWVNLYKSF